MTHMVLGYPSLEDSFRIIETMVGAGVDLMELQIPFSEPIADGPVILRANQKALERGATVEGCLNISEKVAHAFDIPFIIMSYCNIPYRYGTKRFVSDMSTRNLRGALIPDLPPEEACEYLNAMEKYGLAPIFVFSPTTSFVRMKYITTFARGFIYCVARKGVTGANTELSEELTSYLSRCRKATSLPLAVGFGLQDKADIDFLNGKADIAVIGSQTIRIMEEKGIASVKDFIRSLRQN